MKGIFIIMMIILVVLAAVCVLCVCAYCAYELMYMRTLSEGVHEDEYLYDNDVRVQYIIDKRNGGYMR